MIEFQHRTEIDRDPTEVFDTLSAVERLPEWQRSVVTVTKVTHGASGVGSEFQEVLRAMGRTRHVQVRVAAYRAPELIAFAGDAGFGDFYCAFELEPTAAGGTTMVTRTEFRMHGIWKLIAPLLGGEIRRETGRELSTLKRIIEAGKRAPLHATSAG